MEINFDHKNMLSHIRATISNENTYMRNKIAGEDMEDNPDLYVPKQEYADRYSKIDAHSVFSVAFYYASLKALNNKENVFSSIGQYYSLFHLSFALIALNFTISDEKLVKIRHSELKNLLVNLDTTKVITKNYIEFYEDLQEVREYLNYINVPNGFMKFMTLRRGHMFTSRFFKKDTYISSYCHESISVLFEILNKYYIFLHSIECSLTSKAKTNNNRPMLFKSIRRISWYDWYGEDFLNNFFESSVIKEIDIFLGKHDINPPDESFFDDY